MLDALLVSDQRIDEQFFMPKSTHDAGTGFWPQAPIPDILAQAGREPLTGPRVAESVQRQGWMLYSELVRSFSADGKATVVEAHLCCGQAVLKRAEELNEPGGSQDEIRWLAENRHKYLGRWIALRGRQLIADAATAREVFMRVGDLKTPPLVIRVDEEVPFAGW